MAPTDVPTPTPASTEAGALGSVVVPAHNEAAVIGRLLHALTTGGAAVEVVVVANGCTDATAEVSRAVPGVHVIETPVASKMRALALGDRHVTRFPRFYVDADVVISADDLTMLGAALREPGVHAVGPGRHLDLATSSWLVQAYYSVWCRLPGVERELYGRGVIGVDETGHRRLAGWRETMADDLVAAMSFAPEELRVVPAAEVRIVPPREYRDLLRRRVRAMTGNRQLARDPHAPPLRGAGGVSILAALIRREPGLLPAGTVFLATAALARARSSWAVARGDTTWLRDESSRRVEPPAGLRTTSATSASTPRAERLP
ncbi:glycosyltransferase [Georgenia satyanarayanai]|uniref:glycosyltransferase n=1 Tax=Georgenia satyanarayanai TaxID=860221 RepID=UPI00203A4534|nr:glycosyltransferase [Georgenia satyanarayanai]MCM3660808.1 glycosyltransferase [Georgenia satyanarayanai]